MTIDPDAFEILTFDCYGTLIDWERGILETLHPLMSRRGLQPAGEEILEAYAGLEAAAEAGEYVPYREVLGRVVEGLGRRFGFTPAPGERGLLAASLGRWPPFPDTKGALDRLRTRYKLVVVSNVDDDLFEATARALGVPFDAVVTAGQVRAYKPSPRVFEAALRRLAAPSDRILHVAQSLFHDIAPARAMGLTTVWVNRRAGRGGSGATPISRAEPHVEVPELASLARLLLGDRDRG